MGVSVPVNVIAPVASGALLALSIYWIARRRGRLRTVEGNARVKRAAVLVFVGHMILVGLGVNPWRNRFAEKA